MIEKCKRRMDGKVLVVRGKNVDSKDNTRDRKGLVACEVTRRWKLIAYGGWREKSKNGSRVGSLLLEELLVMGLWICSRGGGDTGLRAYVGKNGLDNVEVGYLRTAEGWELKPNNEKGLEGEVPRDIVKNDTKGEGFKEVEESKDYPVGEPLDIIMG